MLTIIWVKNINRRIILKHQWIKWSELRAGLRSTSTSSDVLTFSENKCPAVTCLRPIKLFLSLVSFYLCFIHIFDIIFHFHLHRISIIILSAFKLLISIFLLQTIFSNSSSGLYRKRRSSLSSSPSKLGRPNPFNLWKSKDNELFLVSIFH